MREPIRVDQLQVSEVDDHGNGDVFVYLWDGRIVDDDHLFVAFGSIRRWSSGSRTVETKLYQPVASLADARIVVNRLFDELEKAGAE